MTDTTHTTDGIREKVRERYGRIAAGEQDGCGCGPSCCSTTVASEGGLLGDLGLSCGNPTAIASLTPGEVVLDLGSGGGLDVFRAGPKVGATGRAIGIDMTPEMITKARRGLASYREGTGLDNVEFRLGEIEHLPVPDASVDVVISNCVINLSPDKPQVWREIARVLEPGGRVAISDLVLRRPLPDDVAARIESWVGCVAGAGTVDEVRAMAHAAGLEQIEITSEREVAEAAEDLHDPLYRRIVEHLPESTSLGEYVASADIVAVKPA